MKKLPPITAFYWAMIISATTLGETAGDVISMSMNIGYGVGSIILIGLFTVFLIIQVATKIQHPALYWIVILLTSTAGTTISDFVTRTLGFGYAWGVVIMATLLTIVFAIWKKCSFSLNTSAPLTRTTESLYWLAILVSSTLGTSFGDFAANGTPLGFAGGTLLLLIVLLIITAVTFLTTLPREICYWAAIVVTHPIGATMGDFLTKPDGLNLGNVTSSLILIGIFIIIIGFSYITNKRLQESKARLKT